MSQQPTSERTRSPRPRSKAANVFDSDLAPDAVDGSKILDAAIADADIAAGAVDSTKVMDESLTSSDLATDSVQGAEIADGAVTNAGDRRLRRGGCERRAPPHR